VKISDLIERLKALQKANGDIQVVLDNGQQVQLKPGTVCIAQFRTGQFAFDVWPAGLTPPAEVAITPIVKEDGDGGYWATCPEVPDALARGETEEEAKQGLRAAVGTITSGYRARIGALNK